VSFAIDLSHGERSGKDVGMRLLVVPKVAMQREEVQVVMMYL